MIIIIERECLLALFYNIIMVKEKTIYQKFSSRLGKEKGILTMKPPQWIGLFQKWFQRPPRKDEHGTLSRSYRYRRDLARPIKRVSPPATRTLRSNTLDSVPP